MKGTIMEQYDKIQNLLSTYMEVLNEKEMLEAQIKELKNEISKYLVESGSKKIGFENLGIVQMTEPTTIVSYDKKKIEAIKDAALRDGDIHTARAIEDAKTTDIRQGSLRITKST